MGEVTRDDVYARLVEKGVRADTARMYADLFCEYREAMANIAEHGAVVQHPRTGNPITNPYLSVRDAAMKRLRELRCREAAFLW